MEPIRVVWGTGRAATSMAAYDAALADANVHNYNLVPVSSVVPAEATVEAVGTAPDLGPAGERLTVVQATTTTYGPGAVAAALAWATGDGPGLFYEAADEVAEETIRERARAGLAAGRDLREWSFTDEAVRSASATGEPGTYTAAVVLAAYGETEPIL